MKKTLLTAALPLVLVFLSASFTVIAEPSLSSDDVTENSWTTLAPMPTARTSLDAAVADGKIYAIGGSSRVNEEYDPSTDTWTTKAAVPTAGTGLVAVAVQNKIYAIGGYADEYPGTPLSRNEMYDPTTNSWVTKSDMLTARGGMCANNVNDVIFVMGGFEFVGPADFDPVNKTEAYNPITDTWVTKADMPYATVDHSSVVVGDKIYVFPSDLPSYDTKLPIQIYDTLTDSWSLGSFPPTVQSNADAVVVLDEGGRELIYIIGGGGYGTYLDLVQIYDPENDVWGVGSPMPTPRLGLAVVVVDKVIYALGGVTEGGGYETRLSTNERYTPLEPGSLLPTSTPTSSPTEEPEQPEQDMAAGAILAVASIVVFLGLLVYFIKRG